MNRIKYEKLENGRRYVSINSPNKDVVAEKTVLTKADIEQIFTYLGKDTLTIHDIVLGDNRGTLRR